LHLLIFIFFLFFNSRTYWCVLFLCLSSCSSQVKQPILFLSGLQDELVPPPHMKMLYDKASDHNRNCRFVDFPSGMHMDTWMSGGDRYWRTIQLFLDQYAPGVQNHDASFKSEITEDGNLMP
jgi:abhydrolase domain-containing protein 13